MLTVICLMTLAVVTGFLFLRIRHYRAIIRRLEAKLDRRRT